MASKKLMLTFRAMMTMGKAQRAAWIGLVGLLWTSACSKRESAPPAHEDRGNMAKQAAGGAAAPAIPTIATAEVVTQTDAGAFVSKSAKMDSAPNLEDALKTAKEEYSANLRARNDAMAGWSSDHLKWSDVDTKKNQVSTLLALKDPDGMYGKRACMSGKLASITAVRDTDAGALHYFRGVLEGPGEKWYISAIGDTGELVKGSTAKFCGIEVAVRTERGDAGAADVLDMVGMFDLPENRKK